MTHGLDYLLPAILGISLAAATGFRVFLPLLLTGLAVREGYMPVSDGFAWLSTTPALLMLAVAAVTEVAAYYVPFLDNALDAVATPVAIIAGIAISASVMADFPPMLKWTLAIIAGGGAAAATQTTSALLRGASTVTTLGLGNHAVATGEIIAAIGLSLLAMAAPWLALALLVLLAIMTARIIARLRKKKSSSSA